MINKQGVGCLYMVVTKDEYELPLGVYDTIDEMAEKQRVDPTSIYFCFKKKFTNTKYIKVDYERNEE